MLNKKDPALSAYGKIGGKKSSAKKKRRLGVVAYKKTMAKLAVSRWSKIYGLLKKNNVRPSTRNTKTVS